MVHDTYGVSIMTIKDRNVVQRAAVYLEVPISQRRRVVNGLRLANECHQSRIGSMSERMAMHQRRMFLRYEASALMREVHGYRV